jgi:hypothetical protein
MRARTLLLAVAAMALVFGLAVPEKGSSPQERALTAATVDPPAAVQIFYTPPVVVRAGEEVRIGADAVCTTFGGNMCSADVTLGTQVGAGPWEMTTRPARPDLEFDVTAAAARAIEGRDGGSVGFFLRARNEAGIGTFLGTPHSPLRFWVTRDMPIVRMPSIPFGRLEKPTTALFLPWGSGPMKAGLSLGRESATVGPSAFDVDEEGRIHLLDTMQERLAVFSNGSLDREIPLQVESKADVAVAGDGTSFVLDSSSDVAHLREIDSHGGVGPPLAVGEAISSHLRASDSEAYVNLLPLDAWVRVPKGAEVLPLDPTKDAVIGRPIRSGVELLRVGSGSAIKLAEVSGDAVSHAVEVQSDLPLGEVALAEPDEHGGYWSVVHVWREQPSPGDQYQVLHIRGGKILRSFAVGGEEYADVSPLSRFRLGRDGHLYQLSTSPYGVRILKFELGGEA